MKPTSLNSVPARNRQSQHDHQRRVAEAVAPNFAHALMRAFTELRARLDDRTITAGLHAGSLLAALQPAFDAFKVSLKSATVFLAHAHMNTRTTVLHQANHHAGVIGKASVSFDLQSLPQSTQDALDDYDYGLIQQVSDDVRDGIAQVIQRGITNGWAPAKMAREIRGMIGLTDTQAQAVENYRSMLENGSPDALLRQLRDQRSDGVVQDAVDGISPLSDDQVDDLTGRYQDRYLAYRANTIARYEALRAANAGAYDAIQEAIDAGTLDAEDVTSFWQICDDELTCPACRSIVDMQPDGVPYGAPFTWATTPATKKGHAQTGQIDYAPLHPSCRCTIAFHVRGTDDDDAV
jgi:hypothetical protein